MDLEYRFGNTGTAAVLSTGFHLVGALFDRHVPEFKCPPRPLALDRLRSMIENPRYQRQLLMRWWASQYLAQLRANPLSALNLLNVKALLPRLRRLHGIVRDKRW